MIKKGEQKFHGNSIGWFIITGLALISLTPHLEQCFLYNSADKKMPLGDTKTLQGFNCVIKYHSKYSGHNNNGKA